MTTNKRVVHVDFRRKARVEDTSPAHPLEDLARKISDHLVERNEISTILDSVAAGIRSAQLPETPTGKGSNFRERIAVSICQASARHPQQGPNIRLSNNKADEVLALDEARSLRDVRAHYRTMLATACLTPNAIPDARTITETIKDLKAHWLDARNQLLASEEFSILSRYLSPEHLKRLVPELLIEGDPTSFIEDLCQTYAYYKHVGDHLPKTQQYQDELLAFQNELNTFAHRLPTVVFDGSPPKQIQAIQKRLKLIKAALQRIAQDITPDTVPGNFANLTNARQLNVQIRSGTRQSIDQEAAALITNAAKLVNRIEANFIHSTALYTKLKTWPPEIEAALIVYLAEKYRLSGPVRARLAKALTKKPATR
jgi:hypothetical protein